MRSNEVKVLMGATKEGNIVFANIYLGSASRDYFSVSFDEVHPIEATNHLFRECALNNIDCLDSGDKYDLCEEYDCKPSALVDVYMERQLSNYGVEGLIDISLYPESFSIEGYEDDIYFESASCGQHDTRKELIPIVPSFSEWLHCMWDEKHLKPITDDEVQGFKQVISDYIEKIGDEEEWIKNWLSTEWEG